MENRFVFVATLPPSSVAEEILEQGEDLGRRGFRLAVHSPDDRLLSGGVGESLAEAEAGCHHESQGLGCQEQFVGQAIVLLKLVREESPRVTESGGEEEEIEADGFEAAEVGVEGGEGKTGADSKGGEIGVHPDLGRGGGDGGEFEP